MTYNNLSVGVINENRNSISHKNYQMFFVSCFMAHSVGSILRKVIPGQPNFIEPIIIAIVLYAATFWTLDKQCKRKISPSLLRPILFWAIFLTIYAIVAFFVNPLIGLMAISIRIVPIFMVLIAFRAVRDIKDFELFTHTMGVIALILLPFGLATVFLGYDILPGIMRQIDTLEETKQFRQGIYCFSGIYNSNATLSTVMMATFYSSLALIRHVKEKRYLMMVYAIASFTLVLISTRRGVLFGSLAGLMVYIMIYYVKGYRKVFFFVTVILLLYAIVSKEGRNDNQEKSSQLRKTDVGVDSYYKKQGEFITSANFGERFNNIFLGFALHWGRTTPMGTYLGFGGREAAIFNGPRLKYMVMEVGAALIIAETGIFGVLLLPAVLWIVFVRIRNAAKKNVYRKEIVILQTYMVVFFVIFFTKEATMMVSPVTGNLFFWASIGICASLLRVKNIDNKMQVPYETQVV